MIGVYFNQLEQILQQFPSIQSYTLTKKIYNSKQGFMKGSIAFNNSYKLDFVEVKNTEKSAKIKYRYQYMDSRQALVFRYDNAPHYPHMKTFPHHKHLPEGEEESSEPTLEMVLLEVMQYEYTQRP